MRYRLIPTKGFSNPSIFVEAEGGDELRGMAEDYSEELEKPVLVVLYPDDRQIEPLYTVGLDPSEKKRRVR